MRCSVVVPVRNSAHTLGAALAGVLSQDSVDVEVVVVDDGSIDRPEQVVERLGDPRVRLIHQAAAGVGAARNRGASVATGAVVVFLDADDTVEDGWLAELASPLADPGTALTSCAVVFRHEGTDRRRSPSRLGPAFCDVEALFLAGAFCVRRDLWDRTGGYDPDLRFGENTELGIRLTSQLRAAGLRAVASPRPLLVSHRAPLWLYDPAAVAESAAKVLVRHHCELGADRAFRYDYLTTLGVSSARSGRWHAARTSLRAAWRLHPGRPASAARAALASVPWLARWVWTVPPPRALLPAVASLGPASLEISVVIPTYQGDAVVADLLASLTRCDPGRPWEVVVADNGSTDATRAVVARFAGALPVRLVEAGTERGVAFARNVGASAARGRKLLFVDQDDVVTPGFVAAMADALDHADLAGPRIDCATLNPGWVRQSRTLPQELQLGQDRLPWVYGSGMAIRRRVFFAARGFDGQFTEGGEDIDLCWRLVNRGYRIAYVPEAVLSYRFRSSITELYRQARAYGRAGARLQATYRSAGLESPRPRVVVRHWLGVARRVVTAHSRAKRARAAVLLGNRVGRLEGALRHRVPYG